MKGYYGLVIPQMDSLDRLPLDVLLAIPLVRLTPPEEAVVYAAASAKNKGGCHFTGAVQEPSRRLNNATCPPYSPTTQRSRLVCVIISSYMDHECAAHKVGHLQTWC